MPLVLQDNYSNLAITLYGVRSSLLENTVIGVIQGIFIPTGCLILLTFLLKINCLRWILWIPLWLNWLPVGCTHCTGVTRSSESVYTGFLTTLKVSWTKFNLSKTTKEAITKNHSLCTWQQTKENVLILSPTRSQLFCYWFAWYPPHIALAFGVFSLQEYIASWVETLEQASWKLAETSSSSLTMFYFPLKDVSVFRFSISFQSTLGD